VLETSARSSDTDSVDVRRETIASVPVQGPPASYSPELLKLVEFDKTLSSIAADVGGLEEALTRLRDESADVERLLDERQAELAESELARSRLAEECARSHEHRAEARASLAEAERRLEATRTQVAALEHKLSQREGELAESELAGARLADDCARAREGWAETQAALAEAEIQLDARGAQIETLDGELHSLRLRLQEAQTAHSGTPRGAVEPEPAFHLRLVTQPTGYVLSESPGPPPRIGERVEADGRQFRVARVGRSPLPDDTRRCAFLLPEPVDAAPAERA
jgi:predicted  nucleic acid-binding Zn-ribbon protein